MCNVESMFKYLPTYIFVAVTRNFLKLFIAFDKMMIETWQTRNKEIFWTRILGAKAYPCGNFRGSSTFILIREVGS